MSRVERRNGKKSDGCGSTQRERGGKGKENSLTSRHAGKRDKAPGNHKRERRNFV